MRFSIDFDGVLTDESLLDLSVVNKEWFFWSERSAIYLPVRRGARLIANFLQYFGELIITTARPQSHHCYIQAWLIKHTPELANVTIISSGKNLKPDVLRNINVNLHIDDDFIHANPEVKQAPFIIIWSNQSPPEIFKRITETLNVLFDIDNTTLGVTKSISILSLNSSTPTFRIDENGESIKLRIFQCEEDLERVKNFYKITERLNDIVFLPSIISLHPIAIATVFVEGVMAKDVSPDIRNKSLPILSNFLARLHTANVHEAYDSNNNKQYVSCAVDQFNVCFTPDGRIALIDVCDCIMDSKWVDIIWTEQLYCFNEEERWIFVQSYVEAIKQRPSSVEVDEALRGYYSWLHFIIASGRVWNNGDKYGTDMGRSIAILRSITPKTSMLFRLCNQE